MPQAIKPDPEKYCGHCRGLLKRVRFSSGVLESLNAFKRRKYCNRSCMAAAFDAKPTTSTSPSVTRYHARKMIPPGPCQKCGAPNGLDVHHIDGDHTNNSLENLTRICRSCHLRAHSKKRTCLVCGGPNKGHGYCDKHYQRWKKWGDPLAVKGNQHTPLVKRP